MQFVGWLKVFSGIIIVYEFLISKILRVNNIYILLELVIFDKSHCFSKKTQEVFEYVLNVLLSYGLEKFRFV